MTPFTFNEVQRVVFPAYSASRTRDTATMWNLRVLKSWNARLPMMKKVFANKRAVRELSRPELLRLILDYGADDIVYEDNDGDLVQPDGRLVSIKRGNVVKNPGKYWEHDQNLEPAEIAAVGYHG